MAKILVVDDDDEIREVLAEALAEEGHTVTQARNGREALDLLKREGRWVVLLDMLMPEVSGLEVIRQLEDNAKLADANKIIAMSAGWNRAQKATRPVSPLVVASLPKPFELEDMLAVIAATQK